VTCLEVNEPNDASITENSLPHDQAEADGKMHDDGSVLDSVSDDAQENQHEESMYHADICICICVTC